MDWGQNGEDIKRWKIFDCSHNPFIKITTNLTAIKQQKLKIFGDAMDFDI